MSTGAIGRTGRIHRADVVRTAMAIARRDGLAGLTMRRLGTEMGVDGAAFYHHFRDKAAILRAVGRAAIAEIDVPPVVEFDDWRDWLVVVGRNYHAVLRDHPYLRTLVLDGDVPWTSLPVYATERMYLTDEGIPEHRHHMLLETIHAYVLGNSMVQGARPSAPGDVEQFELGMRALVDGLVARLRES